MERVLREAGEYVESSGVLRRIKEGDSNCTISAGALILDRKSEGLLLWNHKAGKLLLPGGKWERGDESLIDIAKREVKEETGLSDELYYPVASPLLHCEYKVGNMAMLDFTFLFVCKREFYDMDLKGGFSFYFYQLNLLCNSEDSSIKKAATLARAACFVYGKPYF